MSEDLQADTQAETGRSATASPDEAVQVQLARLRAERDALAAQLERRERRQRRPHTLRRIAAALLVLVFVVLLPVATALGWAHRTVFDEDRYLATVAPLGSNPTVTTAVARQLTDEIYAAVNPEPAIKDALPPRAAFLSGPISGQVKSFFGDAMNKALTSPQFAELWTDANRYAHAQLVAVLKDQSSTITKSGDTVVLNLVPLLNAALQNVQPQLSAITGKDIKLPTISGDELPAVACQKVSAALDRPLPQTCGQVPLFPASKLEAVQKSVTRFDRLTVLSLVLLPVLFIGALVVSPRRRRTLLQLTLGGALAVVLLRRLVFFLDDRLTSAAKPENRAAAHVIVSTVLDRLVLITVWILAVALVLAVLALLSGPYRWARALRHGVARAGVAVGRTTVRVARGLAGYASAAGSAASGAVGDAARDRAEVEKTRRWVAANRGALQAGGAVVAVLLLFVLDLSLVSLLVLAVLVALYELAVVRLATGEPDQTPAATPPPRQRTASEKEQVSEEEETPEKEPSHSA